MFAARALTVEGFGQFALAYSSYVLLGGSIRAMLFEPYALDEDPSFGLSEVLRFAVALGCILGFVTAVAGRGLAGDQSPIWFTLALVLPVVSVQDALRFHFFKEGQYASAAKIDGLWLLLLLVGLVSCSRLLGDSPAAFLGFWGATGGLACVPWTKRLARPISQDWCTAARRTLRLSGSFLYDYLGRVAGGRTAVYIVAWQLGDSAVAALQGARVLVGPANAALLALTSMGLAPLAKRHRAARSIGGPLMVIGFGLSVLMVALSAFWLWIPSSVGESVLGMSWLPAKEIVLLVGLMNVGSVVAACGNLGLRIERALKPIVYLRSVTGPLVLLGAFVGGTASLKGAVVGMVLASSISGVAWAVAFWIWRAREHEYD